MLALGPVEVKELNKHVEMITFSKSLLYAIAKEDEVL